MEKYCTQSESSNVEAISAFDTLFTTNHMKILKILFPYLDSEFQKMLAIYIKWQEFIYTLSIQKDFQSLSCSCNRQAGKGDFSSLLPTLLPYCSLKEQEQLSVFSNIHNTMNTFLQIKDYLPMIQTLFSQMQGNEKSSADNNVMDMFKNMMNDEQLSLLSMFMNGG